MFIITENKHIMHPPHYLEKLKDERGDKLSYDEKELEILRKAVDVVEARKGKETMRDPEVQKIIETVEKFIADKKLVCYGGTAINNILPEDAQFYDKDIELPDYDFYSDKALDHAKELADIYYKAGYEDVEAKAGVHFGTYKVFVNFTGIADITQMEPELFKAISKDAIVKNDIHYAPPNFLRMAMYLELSRPDGDVSRWEKVQKRLVLLNTHYPLKGYDCDKIQYQRGFEGDSGSDTGIINESATKKTASASASASSSRSKTKHSGGRSRSSSSSTSKTKKTSRTTSLTESRATPSLESRTPSPSKSRSRSRSRSRSSSPSKSRSKSRSPSPSKHNRKDKHKHKHENSHHHDKSENTYTVDVARLSYSTEKELLLNQTDIYTVVRNAFIKHKVVFFGGYANILYSRYMPKHQRRLIQKIPDFDVLSEDPRIVCEDVVSELLLHNYKKVKYVKHKGVGEVISEHYDIRIGDEIIAFIYKPLACHSYNTLRIENDSIRIATIDTMLSFYLAFIYANRSYYDQNRIICMSQFLFDVQQQNRLKQTGLLKRFSIECYGVQDTLETMRFEKTKKFEELKDKKTSKEFESWFLRYIPMDNAKNRKEHKKSIKAAASKSKDASASVSTKRKTTKKVKNKK
jgi:hypothetical protein